MKLKRSMIQLAMASSLLLSTTFVQALEITDAKGDDKGPGNYTYPTDSVYKPGSFDITKLKVTKKGDEVDFAIDVNSSLADPWGMGVGFSVQMAFIFIKTGADGHADVPPGLNVKFAPGSEWNKLVILSPQKKGRVMGEISTKAADMAKDILVPDSTRGNNRTISGRIPLADLAGDGNIDGWGYQVVMQSNEGFPEPDSLLSRKVNEYEGQHRWGGGNDGNCDPHVMDVLESAEATQKDQLAYQCGPNGEAAKVATLKMMRK